MQPLPLPVSNPRPQLPDPTLLARIEFRHIHLRFTALHRIQLPAFPGATFRGALGRALRPVLCASSHPCPEICQAPHACSYFALFDRTHTPEGQRVPKLWTLTAPLPPGLEDIAYGSAPAAPYRQAPAQDAALPELHCPATIAAEPGAELLLRLTFIGPAAELIPRVIHSLARRNLCCPGGQLLLQRATDASGLLLYDRRLPSASIPFPPAQHLPSWAPTPPPSARLHITLLSPVLIRSQVNHSGPDAASEASAFLQALLRQSVLRAVDLYDSLTVGPRSPKIHFDPIPVSISRHHLYRYRFSRVSLAQNRRMPWDGIIGYLELTGDWHPYLPFLRAAEILGIGQKTTAGMGRLAVTVLGDPCTT